MAEEIPVFLAPVLLKGTPFRTLLRQSWEEKNASDKLSSSRVTVVCGLRWNHSRMSYSWSVLFWTGWMGGFCVGRIFSGWRTRGALSGRQMLNRVLWPLILPIVVRMLCKCPVISLGWRYDFPYSWEPSQACPCLPAPSSLLPLVLFGAEEEGRNFEGAEASRNTKITERFWFELICGSAHHFVRFSHVKQLMRTSEMYVCLSLNTWILFWVGIIQKSVWERRQWLFFSTKKTLTFGHLYEIAWCPFSLAACKHTHLSDRKMLRVSWRYRLLSSQ